MAPLSNDLKLNIISMNVRGLRNAKKRSSLFSHFKNNIYSNLAKTDAQVVRLKKL